PRDRSGEKPPLGARSRVQGAGRRPGERPRRLAPDQGGRLLLRRKPVAARGSLRADLRSGRCRQGGGRRSALPGRGRPDRAGGEMSSPRALVVRSGANPFIQLAPSERLEIVEKVSHTIAPMQPPGVMIESGAKYVVFTSQVSVERAFGDPSLGPLFRKIAEGARAVAVGAATAQALASQGVTADVVAGGSSESILERLPARLDGQRILLPCGEDAPLELQEKLRSRGARVARLVL